MRWGRDVDRGMGVSGVVCSDEIHVVDIGGVGSSPVLECFDVALRS